MRRTAQLLLLVTTFWTAAAAQMEKATVQIDGMT
jgi:hypothetical protein